MDAGCSTGEEAYSIGVVYTKSISGNLGYQRLQLFGCDVSGVPLRRVV